MRLLLNACKIATFAAIGILITITLVPGNRSASAADPSGLEAEMIAIMEERLDEDLDNYEFNDLEFESDEDVNLYLVLFNEMQLKSQEEAAETLVALGWEEDQVTRVAEGQVTGFSEEMGVLNETYQREVEFYRMLSAQENQTLALELFTNGSTRDADFDLLDDLNRIERILFNRVSPSQFGDSINRERPAHEGLSESITQRLVSGDPDRDEDEEAPEEEDDEDEEETTEEDEPDIPESEICQIDDELAESLADYLEDEREAHSVDTDGEDGSSGGDRSDGSRSRGSGGFGGGERKSLSKFQSREEPCEKPFCFYTEYIYKTETAFYPDDVGCIACVLETITAKTAEILDGSLVPHKVTGNFLEPDLCKVAFTENILSMRISLLARPIFPNDDVGNVVGLNPGDLEQSSDELGNPAVGDPSDRLENQAQARTNAGTVGNQQEEVNVTAAQEQLLDDQQLALAGLFEVSQDIESQSALVQSLHQRMQTMNLYFDSFGDMLTEIQQTLIDTQNKPQCSDL